MCGCVYCVFYVRSRSTRASPVDQRLSTQHEMGSDSSWLSVSTAPGPCLPRPPSCSLRRQQTQTRGDRPHPETDGGFPSRFECRSSSLTAPGGAMHKCPPLLLEHVVVVVVKSAGLHQSRGGGRQNHLPPASIEASAPYKQSASVVVRTDLPSGCAVYAFAPPLLAPRLPILG
jgi:hypothetical protein